MIHFIPMHSLQIFAEGGAGGAAGAAGAGDGGNGTAQGQGVTAEAASQQTKGVKGNPLANVKYGIQEEAAPAAEVQKTTEEVPEDALVVARARATVKPLWAKKRRDEGKL